MGLVTAQPTLTSADVFTETTINDRYVAFVAEFNGNIDNANIKSGAAITPAKIADTALVAGNTVSPGTQTVSRPTTFTAATLSLDTTSKATVTVGAGATTAVITAGTNYVLLNHVSSGAAANLTTLTGGTVGLIVKINLKSTTGGANQISLTAAAATSLIANVIRLKQGVTYAANAGGGATQWQPGPLLVYGDPTDVGVNQWWEV